MQPFILGTRLAALHAVDIRRWVWGVAIASFGHLSCTSEVTDGNVGGAGGAAQSNGASSPGGGTGDGGAAVGGGGGLGAAGGQGGAGEGGAGGGAGGDGGSGAGLPSLAQGLLAAWPLDGDGLDQGPSGLDLAEANASYAAGRFGQGLVSPEGNVARPIVDPALALATGDFAVSLWAKPADLQPGFIASTGLNGWWVGQLGTQWIADHAGVVVNAGTATVGAFHHLIWQREAGTLRLYVDGVEVGANGPATDVTDPQEVLRLGHYPPNGAFFVGVIDDLAIWSRALSESERAYLSENPVSP